MVIQNFPRQKLFNGNVGIVVGFKTSNEVYEDESIEELNPFIPAPGDPNNPFEYPLYTGDSGPWPVVKLIDGRQFLCPPVQFMTEDSEGRAEASRVQIPLILAWAITIHKSQGQTIQRLKIDLTRVWAPGQVYVALSRATNLDNLQVLNFRRTKIKVEKRVEDYYHEVDPDDD